MRAGCDRRAMFKRNLIGLYLELSFSTGCHTKIKDPCLRSVPSYLLKGVEREREREQLDSYLYQGY